MLSNILDRISFWSLLLTISVLPIFFLPFVRVPVETSKGLLLVVGLAISIIFYAGARFSDGKIILPKSWFLVSGFAVALVFLLSAMFSSAKSTSFFGVMFDIGSFWFVFAGILMMFMSALIFNSRQKAKMVLLGIFASLGVVFLFQILRIFFPTQLSLGILGGKTDGLIGSWNTFGLFAGFLGVISLFILEFFKVTKRRRIVLVSLLSLSVIIAVIVNFSLIWKLLGIFALIIFVYKISFFAKKDGEENKKVHFPAASFAVVMVSLLFFMSGQFIGSYVPRNLGLSQVEVNPSFSSTVNIAKASFAKDPVFGIGPNRFMDAWAMYKSGEINYTQFWNTPFTSASGIIPTLAVTTGILGTLALAVFLVLLVWTGLKNLMYTLKKKENIEINIFFLGSLYLFISAFMYSGGLVLLLMALAFAGIFVGMAYANREDGQMTISFLDDPRKSFFSILLLVIVMMASAAITFKYVERFASMSYLSKAITATSLPEAEASIQRAVLLNRNDLYLRTYSQVYLAKLNALRTKTEPLTEAEKAQAQSDYNEAISGAVLATEYNSENYLNFEALGAVYSVTSALGIAESYDLAIDSYQKASLLNPLNPGLKLAIANIYNAKNMSTESKDYAQQALTLKPDYVDALIALSQFESKSGNKALAVSYAERAFSLLPNNTDLEAYVNALKNGTSTQNIPTPTPTETEESNVIEVEQTEE